MTLPPSSPARFLGVFAVAVAARAEDDRPTAAVWDEAQLFSPEARQKADEELAEITKNYHLDFLLETVASPPDEVKKQLQAAKTNAQKSQILQAWGARRAEDAGSDGVYVLVCRDVTRGWFGREYGCVVVVVAPEALGRAITAVDAKALHDRLVWFTRGQDTARNDKILHNAVAHVREDLAYNLRPPFPWLQVSGVLLSVLGLWGVLGLVRQRMQGAAVAGPPEPGRLVLYGGLLGGMFGAVAGHWIYDSLFVVASRSRRLPRKPAPAASEDGTSASGHGRRDAGGTERPERGLRHSPTKVLWSGSDL